MKPLLFIFLCSSGLFAQGGAAQPNYMRYQPTFDDIKAVLGLTDDQLSQLKQMQQEKVAATQAFYSKMADKQKDLNQLLETNSSDAAKVGQLMLELQQLRKQPAPAGMDIHDKAVGILTAEQREKLTKIEEAQKLRSTVDQALQLGLVNPPPSPPAGTKPAMSPGMMHPMSTAKPSAKP